MGIPRALSAHSAGLAGRMASPLALEQPPSGVRRPHAWLLRLNSSSSLRKLESARGAGPGASSSRERAEHRVGAPFTVLGWAFEGPGRLASIIIFSRWASGLCLMGWWAGSPRLLPGLTNASGSADRRHKNDESEPRMGRTHSPPACGLRDTVWIARARAERARFQPSRDPPFKWRGRGVRFNQLYICVRISARVW